MTHYRHDTTFKRTWDLDEVLSDLRELVAGSTTLDGARLDHRTAIKARFEILDNALKTGCNLPADWDKRGTRNPRGTL